MKAIFLVTAGLFLAMVSCERHEWESTKALHESHSHGHNDHGDGDGGHGEGGHGAESSH